MSRLENKVSIVSGAARGMGREVARLFAAQGSTVIATDIVDPEPFEDDILFEKLDVTSFADWERLTASVHERFGRIDVLVNNAGIVGSYNGMEDTSEEDWNRTIAVDLNGVWFGMKSVVPYMKTAGKGSIVNFSSIWGIAGVPAAAAYCAAKGAVTNLTRSAAPSHVAHGIRVNSLHPGFIDTPLTQSQTPDLNTAVIASTPMGRAGKPIERAYGALFLASDESSFMTGSQLVIDGGYTAQ